METAVLLQHLPSDFNNNARVWIFQSNRAFNEKETIEINEQLLQFYSQWKAHGEPVKGWAKVMFQQFILVIADESETHVSGCSTDGMMRLIKSVEKQYNVNLFDRMMLTLLVNEKAQMLPFNQISYAIEKGYINENTLVFNNIATTLRELKETWLVPLHKSWVGQRLQLHTI